MKKIFIMSIFGIFIPFVHVASAQELDQTCVMRAFGPGSEYAPLKIKSVDLLHSEQYQGETYHLLVAKTGNSPYSGSRALLKGCNVEFFDGPGNGINYGVLPKNIVRIFEDKSNEYWQAHKNQ
ncbi:hypothetical protein ACSYAD_31500 [Acaryochloris marina NIES-2412]|uniref:hypothetical protein n=1 Tax=Acaryochloris marina TaxID=155978 RepID=UPI0040582B45